MRIRNCNPNLNNPQKKHSQKTLPTQRRVTTKTPNPIKPNLNHNQNEIFPIEI